MTNGRILRVYLRGGLGNQLFQYSAGYALAQEHGKVLVLDKSLLQEPRSQIQGATIWREEISSFQHAGIIADSKISTRSASKIRSLFHQGERLVGDVFGPEFPMKWGSLASERHLVSNMSESSRTSKIRKINAYCAHPQFFGNQQDTIRNQIRHLVNPSDFYLETRRQIVSDMPIVVHLRLGDYLKFPKVFGVLTPAYFDRALSLVRDKAESREVMVFSDEPEKAREILPSPFRGSKFVVSPPHSRPLESMLLLSSSPFKILSNSTFSWWSAFLGQESEAVTVFPNPFLAGFSDESISGFLKDSWVKLDR
jgi:hypothetical protein